MPFTVKHSPIKIMWLIFCRNRDGGHTTIMTQMTIVSLWYLNKRQEFFAPSLVIIAYIELTLIVRVCWKTHNVRYFIISPYAGTLRKRNTDDTHLTDLHWSLKISLFGILGMIKDGSYNIVVGSRVLGIKTNIQLCFF